MILDLKKLSSIFLFCVGLAMAFRPAPPPGTPSMIIDSDYQVNYAYMDVFVSDSIAQVVFISAIDFSGCGDKVVINPNWPVESAEFFITSRKKGSWENYELQTGKPIKIDNPESPLEFRITYETKLHINQNIPRSDVDLPVYFALKPPYENKDGDVLYPRRMRIRLMLPQNMELNRNDKSNFMVNTLAEGPVLWYMEDPAKLDKTYLFELIE